MRVAATVLLLLAVPTTPEARPRLSPYYAALFESGRSWSFRFTVVTEEAQDGRKAPTTVTMVFERSCKVEQVIPVGAALASEVGCESRARPGGPAVPKGADQASDLGTWTTEIPLAGWYLATGKGLWLLGERPRAAELRTLTRRPPRLALVPRVGRIVVAREPGCNAVIRLATSRRRITIPARTALPVLRVEDDIEGGCGDVSTEAWSFAERQGPVLVEFVFFSVAPGARGKLELVSSRRAD